MVKIYIDSGHGGSDGGAQGNGLSEKVLTLKIAKEVERQLQGYENVQTKMSRSSDYNKSLQARTNDANNWGADIFLSIHINSATNPSANGFETHIHNIVPSKTIALQNTLHQEIMNQIKGVTDRGKKRSNFHVLRETNMSSILTENLFIVNKGDSERLKKESFLIKLATGHVLGLEKFLGLRKVANVSEPQAKPNGAIYKVQIGVFTDPKNAQDLAEKAKKAGFDVFIVNE